MTQGRAIATALVVAVGACGDGSTGPRRPGIRAIAGSGGSDTVLSLPATLLEVEVRGSNGQLVPGAMVTFRAVPPPGLDDSHAERGMYVCSVQQPRCAEFSSAGYSATFATTAATDGSGIARARIQFGVIAGPATMEVSAPELGLQSTLPFTTLPGRLASVVPSVRDTAIYAGAGFTLTAHAGDRFGNARPEPVTMTVVTPNVIGIAASRVTAVAIGRGKVVVASGAVKDTVFVTVPPPGRLVTFGWAPDMSVINQLTLVNTDGTARRVILTTPGDNGNALPVWTPDGKSVVFQESLGGQGAQLYLTDTLGTRRALYTTADFGASVQPAYSGDGAGLYFLGVNPPTGSSGIYRANPDGGAPVFLFSGVQPAPSPDGSRVAYVSGSTLYVRDVAGGQSASVAPDPQLPRWSPAGDLLAFVSYDGAAELRLVRADGAGLHVGAPGFRDPGVSWSPDGVWLVTARYGGGLELLRVSDGLLLPIPGTSDLTQPGWRP